MKRWEGQKVRRSGGEGRLCEESLGWEDQFGSVDWTGVLDRDSG